MEVQVEAAGLGDADIWDEVTVVDVVAPLVVSTVAFDSRSHRETKGQFVVDHSRAIC